MSDLENTNLQTGEDSITRCYWGKVDLDYQKYHDEEWGRPTIDDFRLFEKICLEGFQSGLSWLTILRKRENFRKAFAGFDCAQHRHSLGLIEGDNEGNNDAAGCDARHRNGGGGDRVALRGDAQRHCSLEGSGKASCVCLICRHGGGDSKSRC